MYFVTRRVQLGLELALLFLFCPLNVCLLPAQTGDPRDAAVDQDMARLQRANQKHDFEMMVNMAYDPILQSAGGRAAVLDRAKRNMTSFTMDLETIKPYTYLSGVFNDYVIIPTHFAVRIENHRYEYHSYQLGIRPHEGTEWKYVDGTKMTPQLTAKYLPDLPGDAKLPKVWHRVLAPTDQDASNFQDD